MDCKMDVNRSRCNCSYPCSRAAVCCDCIASHRRAGELPACYFPATAERTYDRTIEHFIRIYQRGGWR